MTCARCGHVSGAPAGGACPACGHRDPAPAPAWPTAGAWRPQPVLRPELTGASTVLIVSILCATSCCMPAGVVGVLWTEKAKKLWLEGRDAEAEKTLSQAKMMTYGGAAVGLVLGVVVVILQVAVELIK